MRLNLVSHVLDVHVDTVREVHIVLKHVLQVNHWGLRLLAASPRVLLLLLLSAHETVGSGRTHRTKSTTIPLIIHLQKGFTFFLIFFANKYLLIQLTFF